MSDPNITNMAAHPLAEIFPPMSDTEFASLRDDIHVHGVREPIWTWRDQVIDGRHRQRACVDLGIECPTREYQGDESSLVPFVVSLNIRRRNLSESQLAFVALEAEKVEAELAKRRQGAQSGFAHVKEQIPEHDRGQARDKAAAAVGVNPHYVSDAKAIQRDAPELAVEIRAGAKTITQAKREIKERKRDERRAENAAVVQRAPTLAETLHKIAVVMKRTDPKTYAAFVKQSNKTTKRSVSTDIGMIQGWIGDVHGEVWNFARRASPLPEQRTYSALRHSEKQQWALVAQPCVEFPYTETVRFARLTDDNEMEMLALGQADAAAWLLERVADLPIEDIDVNGDLKDVESKAPWSFRFQAAGWTAMGNQCGPDTGPDGTLTGAGL